MDVVSTRDSEYALSATRAVLKGISPDGGLFVPSFFPKLDLGEMRKEAKRGYAELAAAVMAKFFDLELGHLKKLTRRAYAGFDAKETVPVVPLAQSEHVMELFHGPTLAFKDMALRVLPHLISEALALHEQEKDVLILTATSGDTGKAALEGFRDVPRTAIYVFYPLNGVSPMQKLQMVTQEGTNTGVCAVKGNFDDAQNGVKALFGDKQFNREAEESGFTLSSANSINFGRLIPQVAYYVYAYAKLAEKGKIERGDPVNFCVPTGNFGNILAAYYAMLMGVPVHKLICASNRNNVLTDFFEGGGYDTRRAFFQTMSPSMDILISSNLERLLFELTDRDGLAVKGWMNALQTEGKYVIPRKARDLLAEDFYADYCDEEETAQTMRKVFDTYGYLMDPHTAVAQCVYDKYQRKTGDDTVTVVASTANPFKFTQDALRALTGEKEENAFYAADALSAFTGIPVPAQIAGLIKKPALHTNVVEKGGEAEAVRDFMKYGERRI